MNRLIALAWLCAGLLWTSIGVARQPAAAPPAAPPPALPTLPVPTPAVAVPSNLESALEKIRSERAALERERREAADVLATGGSQQAMDRLKMRVQIAELMQRLKDKHANTPHTTSTTAKEPPPKEAPEKDPPAKEPPPKEPSVPPGVVQAAPPRTPVASDRVALAQVQFRARNYAEALKTIDSVDRTDLTSSDRAWLDYLKAGCLRQTGKLTEAAALYKTLAALKEEAFLSENAAWQLSFLQWRQQMQTQLGDLRKQP